MSYLVKQSTATKPLLFLMVQSADHITGATGVSPTVTLSKNGGAFSSPAGSVTEIGSGWYQVAANATDSNTLGPLVLHATGTAADPTDVVFRVVAFDPDSTSNLGLSNLDAAVSTRSTYAGGPVASVTAAVTVGTNNDKSGYALSSSGLDSISTTPPSSAIGSWNFREIMIMLFRRFFGKATVTSTQLKTYGTNGTTVLSTQSLSDNGTTQTQGEGA